MIGAASGLCGASGRTAFDPIIVEKRIDRASVPLLAQAARGRHIQNARISVWTTGATPRQIAAYDLADVVIGSVRQVQRGDSLTEEVSLTFARITWTFTPLNADGSPGASIQACWDVALSAAC